MSDTKLICFDLDDTLIREIHSVMYLSILNNKLEEIIEIERREANGEFTWIEADYHKAKLAYGLDIEKIATEFNHVLKPINNIVNVIATLRKRGFKCILITAGPKQVAKVACNIWGLNGYSGSDYEIVDGKFTGKITKLQEEIMLNIKNNSDTMIIVLNEIYGINRHMKFICDHFYMNGYDVVCPDLINTNQPFNYNQEEVAYLHFIEDIGFESAFQKVKKLIVQVRAQYKYIFLVGFSIGATIAWLCSNESNISDGVIGYYGSRIRDYIDVTPKCPVLLLFPTEEKSLNVEELISSLERMNVDIHILNGKHGFSDPFNKNYCEQSYKDAEKLADNFLNRVRKGF